MSGRKVCELCKRPRGPEHWESTTDTECLACFGLKRCTKCGLIRTMGLFYAHRTSKSGAVVFRGPCKWCERVEQKARRATEHGRELKRQQRRRRNMRRKSGGPPGATIASQVVAPGGHHQKSDGGPPGATIASQVVAPTNQVVAPGGHHQKSGGGPRGGHHYTSPSVAQLNAAALAAVPAKATAKVWASGHDPADYPGFAPHLFDLPGFDPLDLSTWPDESL